VLRLALFASLIALTCARAPAGESQPLEDPNGLLYTACEGAFTRLDPERTDGAPGTFELPVELAPTLRALHGTGMGARVDALDAELERAARLALRETKPWLEGAVKGFAPAAQPTGGDDALSVAFRAAHEAALRAQLRLAAGDVLVGSGARGALDSVREGAQRLPLRRAAELDLVSVVTERALARFFSALAEQEKSLREQRETLRGGYGGPPNSGSLPGSEERGGSR
jgi:hypothetical protein